MSTRPYYNTNYGNSYYNATSSSFPRSSNKFPVKDGIEVARPEISSLFAEGVPQQTLNSQRSLSGLGVGPLRRLDVSAKVSKPPIKNIPSPRGK